MDLSMICRPSKAISKTDGYSGYTIWLRYKMVTHTLKRHTSILDEGNLETEDIYVMKLIHYYMLLNLLFLPGESKMHNERYTLRLDKSLPIIINEIGQYIQQERNKVTPKSPQGKALIIAPTDGFSLQKLSKRWGAGDWQ